jgi:hypothetical protein
VTRVGRQAIALARQSSAFPRAAGHPEAVQECLKSDRFLPMTPIGAEAPTSLTPILDWLAPLPRPAAHGSGSRIILGVVTTLFIAILATLMLRHRQWILMNFERMFPGSWTYIRVIFVGLSIVLIGFFVTAIHELGHLIVGICVGFRCRSMFLGPLQFNGPFRISLYPDPRAWWHGGVILFPVRQDKLRGRGIAMVFAGPAANLLTGCAVLLLPLPIGFFAGCFIVASILAGVVELLLPLQGPTFVLDGRRILMMLRNRELGERWLALMRLSAETSDGVLPESMSAEFLAKAIVVRDNSADTVIAHAFAYSAAFHQHRNAEAGQMLETCLRYASYVAPALREALMSDAAVFQARRRQRADLAEQWLAAMPATTTFPWLRSRVEAAILEAQGDVDGALRKLDESQKAILSIPNQTQRGMLLRLLLRWKSELNSG